ncbi:lipopolysaccharide biosynthesis protein [Rhodovibrio sodomensis]|nr:lipopolysaccharide biosynthesis protein [Rhodovibrio sodomensis]
MAGRTARGGAWALGGQAVKFAGRMASVAILARLLTPADFGLVAMAAPIVAFVGLFKDFGLSAATIQRDRITQDQLSALYWINVLAGLLLSAAATALAPAVGWFYGDQRLVAITAALGLSFALSGLQVQPSAVLRRQLRLRRLTVIQVSGYLIGIAVAVVSAHSGAGAWALVYGTLAGDLASALLLTAGAGWRPGRPARCQGLGQLLGFGGHVTAFNLINFFPRNLDNILVGRVWGEGALGLYSKAYELLLLPVRQVNGPITQAVVPALSRLRDEPERYRRYYVKSLRMIVTLTAPAIAFLVVAIDPLVRIVLGPQWLDMIPIFQALGPAALIGTSNIATGWVFVSWGHVRRQVWLGLISATIVSAGFLLSVSHGPVQMALTYSLIVLVIRWPQLMLCYHGTPVRLRDFFAATGRPMATAVLASALVFLVGPLATTPAIDLAGRAGVFALAALAFWIALPGGLAMLREMTRDLRHLRGSAA